MNREQENSLSDKKIRLYRAVEQLLSEGMDINNMKVSDITERAGIGKGTAYEYFDSKEELIAKALAFHIETGLKVVKDRLSRERDFSGKIRAGFDWLEENGEKRYLFQNFLKVSMQSYEISRPVQEKWCELLGKPGKKQYHIMMKELLDAGRADGSISADIKDAQAVQLLVSQSLGYLAYLQNRSWAEEVSPEEMKDFICKSLLKCLK